MAFLLLMTSCPILLWNLSHWNLFTSCPRVHTSSTPWCLVYTRRWRHGCPQSWTVQSQLMHLQLTSGPIEPPCSTQQWRHFMTERWTFEERVLDIHHVPESNTATNFGDALYSTAERWTIIRDHCINAVATDNASNVIAVVALSELETHIGWFFSRYQNLVALGAFGTQVLSCLLGLVRWCVSCLHQSNIASHILKEK